MDAMQVSPPHLLENRLKFPAADGAGVGHFTGGRGKKRTDCRPEEANAGVGAFPPPDGGRRETLTRPRSSAPAECADWWAVRQGTVQ